MNDEFKNSNEYEMYKQEQEINEVYRNKMELRNAKKVLNDIKPQLNKMKYENFENPKKLKKIVEIEEIIKTGEKIINFLKTVGD